MRLKKGQKERLLVWIADGLLTDEINDLAAAEEPFSVSRSQVNYYRRTRGVEIEEIREAGEHEALVTGLARKAERVEKLKKLAALFEGDLFGESLWLDQVKVIGTGPMSERVEYDEFNKPEVDCYRGVLDDIAREVGDRVAKADFTSKGEQIGVGGEPEMMLPELRAWEKKLESEKAEAREGTEGATQAGSAGDTEARGPDKD